jgi:hypothetical protein
MFMSVLRKWLIATAIRTVVKTLENFPFTWCYPSLSWIVVVTAFLLNASAFGASLVAVSMARDPNLRLAGASQINASHEAAQRPRAGRLAAAPEAHFSMSNDETQVLYRQLMHAEQQDARDGHWAGASGK